MRGVESDQQFDALLVYQEVCKAIQKDVDIALKLKKAAKVSETKKRTYSDTKLAYSLKMAHELAGAGKKQKKT